MSNSLVVKYQPLSQSAPSDDEDEGFHDNVLYDSRLVVGPSMDHRNVFELEKLGQPRVRSPGGIQSLSRGHRLCVLAVVLLLIVFGVLVAVLFPILSHKYNHGIVTAIHTGKTSPDWLQMFNTTWTHSLVRLLDADGDGLDDILIGLSVQGEMDSMLKGFGEVTECCSSSEDSTSGGRIVALRGYDGKVLWQAATHSVPYFLNCLDVDVNGDGKMDCIVAGRDLSCRAIDVLTGTSVWVVGPDSPNWPSDWTPGWGVDGLITVSDLDLDGVLDMVLLLSEHQDTHSEKLVRQRHRLVLLSGKTGLVVGSGYVEFTRQGDGVMPMVKFVTAEGAVYILFGSSGEENNEATLMAISLPDLYHITSDSPLSKFDLSIYGWLEGRDKDKNGLTILFSGQDNGEVLTSILVQPSTGGHSDILVSSSSGLVLLLNGQTLQERWRQNFHDLGIYSSPMPGYFDTDAVLDFMVQLRTKPCQSRASQTLVLSGLTGETLWAFEAENHTLSSCLSLETVTSKSSVFVVALDSVDIPQTHLVLDSGTEAPPDVLGDLSGQQLQDLCRDLRQKFAGSHVTCDRDLQFLTQKVFLLDHVISDQPLHLLDRPAYQFSYSLQHASGSQRCHSLSSQHQDQVDMCTVLVPAAFTGVVGDVDGDGSLDYIHVAQMMGLNTSDTLHVTGTIGAVVVSKHNINSAIAKGEFQHIKPSSDHGKEQQGLGSHQHVKAWQFSQTAVQAVGQYSGVASDCPFVST